MSDVPTVSSSICEEEITNLVIVDQIGDSTVAMVDLQMSYEMTLEAVDFSILDPCSNSYIDVEYVDAYMNVLKNELGLQGSDGPFSVHLLKAHLEANTSTFLYREKKKEEFHVQVHHIDGHYVVSCQKGGQLFIYDSMKQRELILNHVRNVYPQLKLIYEQVSEFKDLDRINICCPQDQETSCDCALYALANAYMLLKEEDPCMFVLNKAELRQTLRSVQKDAKIPTFPGEKDHEIITSFFYPWLRKPVSFVNLYPTRFLPAFEQDSLVLEIQDEISFSETETDVSNPIHLSVDDNSAQVVGDYVETSIPLNDLDFSKIRPDSQTEIAIEYVEAYLELLKMQLKKGDSDGPYSLRLLKAHVENGMETFSIPKKKKDEKHVQVHSIPGHFVVSSQKDGFVTLYDSVQEGDLMLNHLKNVFPQLKLIYEQIQTQEDFCKIKVCCPQDQKDTNNSAVFALSTANLLMYDENPCVIAMKSRFL